MTNGTNWKAVFEDEKEVIHAILVNFANSEPPSLPPRTAMYELVSALEGAFMAMVEEHDIEQTLALLDEFQLCREEMSAEMDEVA